MDEIRDIQKRTNNLERFFDSSVSRVNPFGENRSANRAYQRIERIVAAIYLLTNHIPVNEPVRISVRSNALLLIEYMLSVSNEMRSLESAKMSSLRSEILHIISLVRMLAVSGFVSSQNAEIVIESLNGLGDLLVSSQRSNLSEGIRLSESDFDFQGRISIGHDKSPLKDLRDNTNIKDVLLKKDKVNVSTGPILFTQRQQNILGVLRSGGELGIRDIASNMPEYSEKMIQRELAELVALGQVRKTGLKRWSKYALAI
jgi:hypothetical protein